MQVFDEKCTTKEQRLRFVESVMGVESYCPVYKSHGGGFIEGKKTTRGIVYYYEGSVEREERRPLCENKPERGTVIYRLWQTTTFVFTKDGVEVSTSDSYCHVDGTLEREDDCGESDSDFGSNGFGRWNDNSTGIWDWD